MVRNQCWSALLLTVLLLEGESAEPMSLMARVVGCLHNNSASRCRCLCLHDELDVNQRLKVDLVVARGYYDLGEAQSGKCKRDHGGSEHDGDVDMRLRLEVGRDIWLLWAMSVYVGWLPHQAQTHDEWNLSLSIELIRVLLRRWQLGLRGMRGPCLHRHELLSYSRVLYD